jgi:hypothetical protein
MMSSLSSVRTHGQAVRSPHEPGRHQTRHPMHFSNSPLQFFSSLWYKQFTESRCVAEPVFVCNSRVRPASKQV